MGEDVDEPPAQRVAEQEAKKDEHGVGQSEQVSEQGDIADAFSTQCAADIASRGEAAARPENMAAEGVPASASRKKKGKGFSSGGDAKAISETEQALQLRDELEELAEKQRAACLAACNLARDIGSSSEAGPMHDRKMQIYDELGNVQMRLAEHGMYKLVSECMEATKTLMDATDAGCVRRSIEAQSRKVATSLRGGFSKS